jgi:hypothetical protein
MPTGWLLLRKKKETGGRMGRADLKVCSYIFRARTGGRWLAVTGDGADVAERVR